MDKNKTKAALEIAIAIAEAIQELGEVPSGHLYARVMGTMSLDTYNAIIGALKNTGLVKEDPSHLLTWTGPAKKAS